MNPEKMEDKLDKIIRVVTRTEVQVEALIRADAHTRLTKLESRNKAIAIAAGVLFSIAAFKDYVWELVTK